MGGAWWNNLLDCVLQWPNKPSISLVWTCIWPNKIPRWWILTVFGKCFFWKISLLSCCPPRLGWGVVCGPSIWGLCVLLYLNSNEQKGRPILIPLRLLGRCALLWIWHALVHWVKAALVGACWDLLLSFWGNYTLTLYYWLQDLTRRRRRCGCVGPFQLQDILWWPLNGWQNNWVDESLIWLWIVCCWTVLRRWCSIPLSCWGISHTYIRGKLQNLLK